MITKISNSFRLDIGVKFGGSLFQDNSLDKFQELLRKYAPTWSRGLHIWRDGRKRCFLDLSVTGILKKAILPVGTERGELFHQLIRTYGAKTPPRRFGSVELRGGRPSLILVIELDEQVFFRIGQQWKWGNAITIQVCRKEVEGKDSVRWAAEMFEALCGTVSPWYGSAHMMDEYDCKNMLRDGGKIQAVGIDAAKALPGLYWLNFFGTPYVNLIGYDRLATAPAQHTQAIDDGILVRLHEQATAWQTSEYLETERRVMDHLGSQYFFSKNLPNKHTIAPNFSELMRE